MVNPSETTTVAEVTCVLKTRRGAYSEQECSMLVAY